MTVYGSSPESTIPRNTFRERAARAMWERLYDSHDEGPRWEDHDEADRAYVYAEVDAILAQDGLGEVISAAEAYAAAIKGRVLLGKELLALSRLRKASVAFARSAGERS
jgi:hypothetical protein